MLEPDVLHDHYNKLLLARVLEPFPFLRYCTPAPPKPWYRRTWNWLSYRYERIVTGCRIAFTEYDIHESCD